MRLLYYVDNAGIAPATKVVVIPILSKDAIFQKYDIEVIW